MKKTFIAVTLCLLPAAGLQAQPRTVEKTLPVPANKKIDLQLSFGNSIKVTAWDKEEAYVRVTYEINGGKLNDALLLDFASDQESARVEVELDEEKIKNGRPGDCPGSGSSYSFQHNGQGSYTCADIAYEIFVPRDADLTVETISGDVELRGLTGPVHAKSISGFVDMDWPGDKGATVLLETVTGEVYSDLGEALAGRGEDAPLVGHELRGNVNGGGARINLESVSNDIFFRKQD